MLSDDEVGEGPAGFARKRDSHSDADGPRFCLCRIDHAVKLVIAWRIADVGAPDEPDHTGRGVGKLILSVGSVVFVRGDRPHPVMSSYLKRTRRGRVLVELDDLKAGGVQRIGEVLEEHLVGIVHGVARR